MDSDGLSQLRLAVAIMALTAIALVVVGAEV